MVARGEARASDFKFVLGHAGWGPGQLEGEIKNNTWLVAAAGGCDGVAPEAGREAGGGEGKAAAASGRGRKEDACEEEGAGRRKEFSRLVFCSGEEEEGEEEDLKATEDPVEAFAQEVRMRMRVRARQSACTSLPRCMH